MKGFSDVLVELVSAYNRFLCQRKRFYFLKYEIIWCWTMRVNPMPKSHSRFFSNPLPKIEKKAIFMETRLIRVIMTAGRVEQLTASPGES